MATFEQSDLEQMIRSSVRDLMDDYDREYWREVIREREFAEDFWHDLADHGWVGVTVPEEYGGQGMGMQEMIAVVEEVGMNGGWVETGRFVLTPIFGAETLRAHGTEEQKEKWLPRIAAGEAHWALGVTEPDAGLNTTNITTTADKDGDEYVINGRKIFTSEVGIADGITLLARTTPKDEVEKPTQGLSILLVDPDAEGVEYDEITMGTYFHDRTYNLYLDDVRVHESKLIGQQDEGLYHIFDTLNTERITIAAQTIAIGHAALERAVEYANEREVFDAPIGAHQAIQHPLADAYAGLECARLMNHKAAWMYDEGKDQREVGGVANAAKLKAAEAAWEACEAAMTTFGGMSVAEEIGISQMWSVVRHLRIAPVSEQMIRNYLAEHELDLPRSY